MQRLSRKGHGDPWKSTCPVSFQEGMSIWQFMKREQSLFGHWVHKHVKAVGANTYSLNLLSSLFSTHGPTPSASLWLS